MQKPLLALSPLAVFVALFVVVGIGSGSFYRLPVSVAFLAASVWAVAVVPQGLPLSERIGIFSRGAASSQMMLMIWIFVLAGAFATTAKGVGAIDATVSLTLACLPPSMLLAGLFLAACFVSLAVGTSVGTIVALVPIASGVAAQTGASPALMTAVIVGGSFFGDNLSFISDTTIVATQTQGCRLSDKFRVNAFIVIPPALLVLVLYLLLGSSMPAPAQAPEVSVLKVLPYLAVLVFALIGMHVCLVLTVGIALTFAVGLITGSLSPFAFLLSIGDGIDSMSQLIIVTMMAGGMLEVIKHGGGIDYIIERISSRVKTPRGAELAIGFLVAFTDVCTANNTVAIITVGGIARQIGSRYHLDNRRCASLLDTFSCAAQGLLPYGAQLLMAAGLASLSPMQIIPYLFYPMAILIAAILAVLFRYPRRFSKGLEVI